MSFEIVRHAFVMVFGNLRDSIKVSLVPLLLIVLATFLLPPLFGLSMADVATAANVQAMMEGHPAGPMASVVGLLLAVLYFFSMSWIAVGWHRFILLEEYPRFLPQLPLREVLGYLGRSFAIGVVVVIVAVDTHARSVVTGPEIINDQSRAAMRKALERIQNGEYAKSFILEGRTGYPSMTARRRLTEDHSIEKVGSQLRSMMPWIAKNKLVDKSRN